MWYGTNECRFNFLGQVAVTTGITFGCAGLVSVVIFMGNPDYVATPGKTIGIYAALLVSQGTVNTFGVHILRYLNNSSIILHSLGVFALIVAVLAKAPTHQSAKFVFATFYDGTGVDGIGWSIRASPAYVAVCGILMSQYTITGFDASAHLSEETVNAEWNAPIGVLMAIGVSAVFGFFVLVGLLFAIQDFDRTVNSATEGVGQPVAQILVDVFGTNGAIVLMVLILVCVWHCGLFSLTSNSRMMFAFARDGGIPHFFHNVDKKFRSPIRTGELFLIIMITLLNLTFISVARGILGILPRPPLSRIFSCFRSCYLYCDNRAVPFLRYPNLAWPHLSQGVQEGTFQSRHSLAPRRFGWSIMDRFPDRCLLPA
jgi:amino acid transporter